MREEGNSVAPRPPSPLPSSAVSGCGLNLSPGLVAPVSPCSLFPGLMTSAVALDQPWWQRDPSWDK